MDGDKTKDEKNYKIRSMETDLKSQKGGAPAPTGVPLDLGKKSSSQKPPPKDLNRVTTEPKIGFAKEENTPKAKEKLSPFSKPIQKPYDPNKDLKMPPRVKPLTRPTSPPSNIPVRPSVPKKHDEPRVARPINLDDLLKEAEKAPSIKPKPLGPPPVTPPEKSIPNLADELPKIKKSHHPKPKRIIILSVVAGLILLFIIGEIWWFFLRPSGNEGVVDTTSSLPSPEEVNPPKGSTPEEMAVMEELKVSNSLINYSGDEIISLSNVNASDFSTKLITISKKIAKDTTLRLVPALKDTDGERLLTFNELTSVLGITVSSALIDTLSGEFDVFLFGGSVKDQTTCQSLGNNETSCYGTRLGIILKTKGDPSSALALWEGSMVSNLTPLILSKTTVDSGGFLSATYKSVPIKYKNLPLDTTTIDYAISGDLLIITTSKESMFKVIDSLK